jgi:hypothetical protein
LNTHRGFLISDQTADEDSAETADQNATGDQKDQKPVKGSLLFLGRGSARHSAVVGRYGRHIPGIGIGISWGNSIAVLPIGIAGLLTGSVAVTGHLRSLQGAVATPRLYRGLRRIGGTGYIGIAVGILSLCRRLWCGGCLTDGRTLFPQGHSRLLRHGGLCPGDGLFRHGSFCHRSRLYGLTDFLQGDIGGLGGELFRKGSLRQRKKHFFYRLRGQLGLVIGKKGLIIHKGHSFTEIPEKQRNID